MNESYFKMGDPEKADLPSIYDKIGGFKGLAEIVWKARRSVFSVPYCLSEYKKLFKNSNTPDELYILHQDGVIASSGFRKRRLLYFSVRRFIRSLYFDVVEDLLLKKYEIPKRKKIDWGVFGGLSRDDWGKAPKDSSRDGKRKVYEDTHKKIWFRMPEYSLEDLSKDGERKALEEPSRE